MAVSTVFKILLIVLLSVVLTYSLFMGAWIHFLQQKSNDASVTTPTNTTTPYSGVKCDINQSTNMKNIRNIYNHTKTNNDTSEILTTENEKRLNVDTTILLPDTNRTDINIDNIHILPTENIDTGNSVGTTKNEQGIKASKSTIEKPSGSFGRSDFDRILPFLFVVERYDGKYLCHRVQSSLPASPTSKNCVMIDKKFPNNPSIPQL